MRLGLGWQVPRAPGLAGIDDVYHREDDGDHAPDRHVGVSCRRPYREPEQPGRAGEERGRLRDLKRKSPAGHEE